MSATNMLLFCLVVVCGLCLFALFIVQMINAEWQRADEPLYRTADASAIRRQTARIIASAQASAHTSAHEKATQQGAA